MLTRAAQVGPRPTLFAPWALLAEELTAWIHSRETPPEFRFEFISNMPSAGGASYVGTIEGVDVYQLIDLSA